MAESRRLATEYRRLARFWRQVEVPEGGDPSEADEYEAETLAVALALRCTRAAAYHRINDARRALTGLPGCFARLAAGEFPSEWFQRLLRRSHHLTATDLTALDQSIATWPLGQLTVEQYRRRLSHALTRIDASREVPAQHTPEGRRRVDLLPVGEDGIGCLQVIGPIPEILTLAQRLDASARAIQHTQRHTLEAGEPPPLDPDGTVTTQGRPLSLARLRYELLTGAGLDTDGVRVLRERFRLTVTVPALTLLGASEEPGTLDGTIPIPAVMARELAGQCETWHRVLTDPARGAFLPLPAQTYRPDARLLEHLRLRHATCAMPGCTRPSSWASECDHIQEYDHTDPARGGLTEVENLHLLCWMHHCLKTAGLIDPVRSATPAGRPGVTEWEIEARARIAVRDDTDLATPAPPSPSSWRPGRPSSATGNSGPCEPSATGPLLAMGSGRLPATRPHTTRTRPSDPGQRVWPLLEGQALAVVFPHGTSSPRPQRPQDQRDHLRQLAHARLPGGGRARHRLRAGRSRRRYQHLRHRRHLRQHRRGGGAR